MASVKFTTILVIFIVLILPGLLSFAVRVVPNGVQPSFDKVQAIHGYTTVSQSFISEQDNLIGIGLSLKNPNLENKKDITLSLYDQNTLLRTTTLNGKFIQDGKFVKFTFDSAPQSKDKIFTFQLSAPQATEDDALEVFLTDGTPSWSKQLTLDNQVSKGSVSFVTLHRPQSLFSSFLEIYSDWFNRFFADTSFAVFYLSLITILIGYLLYLKSSSKTDV